MKQHYSYTKRSLGVLAFSMAVFVFMPLTAMAEDVPDYMKIITVNEGDPTSKDKIAFKDLYALNEGMFPIYENRLLPLYKKHPENVIPLIMALFSGDGGRFILYPPGKDPIEAASPPAVYKMAKSVGHCAMATYDLVAPFCTSSDTDQSWVGEMKAYRTRVQTAFIASLDQLENIKPERPRLTFKDTLEESCSCFHG